MSFVVSNWPQMMNTPVLFVTSFKISKVCVG